MLRRLRLIVLAALAGLAVGFLLQLLEEKRTWGVVPRDARRELPGDGLIAAPDVSETRSLSIAATPAEVWPWLVQMGFGRGGWYSYDQVDMDSPSAETILDEFQDLAEGDLVPTHPGGGFVAREVEPERALVLYLDTELVQSQMDAAVPEGQPGPETGEDVPAGLQMAGAMGDLTLPDFRGTWAFVLEPEADGGTRLIERIRLWAGEAALPPRLGLPMMGLGIFVMTRKHMLGVKERAERLAAGASTATSAVDPEA
jgi:hypothetical protein